MSAFDRNEKRTLIAVGAIIAAGGVAGIVSGRGDAGAEPHTAVLATQPAATESIEAAAPSAPIAAPAVPAKAPALLGEAEVTKLAEESMSGPAAVRVAAIERLSKAPRDQALPLLKRVLNNGDPTVDRPAALLGLRDLALSQGDADERIRDAVREVVYHGDDENLAADAQKTLDVIARAETK